MGTASLPAATNSSSSFSPFCSTGPRLLVRSPSVRSGFLVMSIPVKQDNLTMGVDQQSRTTPSWTIDVPDVRTVKVSNLPLAASVSDIEKFFSFSGHIVYVEMRSESEMTQVAYVTFNDAQAVDAALLLSGSMIITNHVVTVTPVENYQLPPEATNCKEKSLPVDGSIRKTEEVVSTMLAKGYVLGKDALKRARSFDERHQLLSSTIASLDQRIGLSEKISNSTAAVSGKLREVDEQLQVSEIARSALAATEQTIMSIPYVSIGASWVTSAFCRVVKAAEDVSVMTKEKVEMAEFMHRQEMVDEFAKLYLDDSSPGVIVGAAPGSSMDDR